MLSRQNPKTMMSIALISESKLCTSSMHFAAKPCALVPRIWEISRVDTAILYIDISTPHISIRLNHDFLFVSTDHL